MNFTIMLSDGVSTMAAASSTTSSTRTLSSSSSSSSSQESVSTAIGSIVSTATNQSTTRLGNYKPPSSNQVSIGLNIIQSTTSNNSNVNNTSNSILTSSASSLSSSSNLGLRSNQINILQNEIVPTILGHHNQHTIPSDIEQQIHSAIAAASTSSCNVDGICGRMSTRHHSSNLIDNNSSIITTTHNDNLKVITMSDGSSLISSVDVNNHQCSSIDVIDDCCPSTTLSHDAILMQITDDTMIPTSPIATLSLNSNVRQSIGVNNNNKNAANNNILFNTVRTTSSTDGDPLAIPDDIVSNNEQQQQMRIMNANNILFNTVGTTASNNTDPLAITVGTGASIDDDPLAISNDIGSNNEQQQMRIISGNETSGSANNRILCNNNFNPICSSSTSSAAIVATTSSGNIVVSTTPSSSSSSSSTSFLKDNNKTANNRGNIITGVTLVTGTSSSSNNNASTATDDLNMNTDSLSSGSLQIDDTDQQLDDNEGYQDNASSNSQQSGGGGNVSGVGGVGSIASGNGTTSGVIAGNSNNSYISLLPPPVGTTGTTGQSGESLDFKYLFEELCPVCGDKVSGYHYGLLTCESCKGFFKRTVQNKKVYTCVAERSCHIDKTQRKRCPYCRFQKCLEVGMKLEAVRADRMRGGRNKFGPMYKRDRARKLQMMRQRQLALQAIRGSMGGGSSSTDLKPGQISPTGYQQSYPSMSIKQEIQIPQVSSLTQSPDSSPSPIAIALGQVNPSTAVNASSLGGGNVSTGPGSTNTTTVSGGTSGSGSHGHGSDTGSSTSLQHTSDSKLCFDTGTNPTSTADSVSAEPLRVSPMIREFVQSIDDREWQTQLFTLLQKQSYNQVEVDLFELMCKVLDQNLFSQVDWARNTVFFKDLKVDDQMKLLQHSWSDMLVLDHLHQRIHNNLPDETPLNNGQVFNLLGLGLLGVPQLADYFNELQNKLQELKFDMGDYVCMKFLILLNPNVRGILNKKTVLEGHENVQAALLDYTLTCYPTVTDKFSRLLSILPDIHAMAARGEEHLYLKHVAGNAPTQTLLMEMLHAKRKV